MARDIDLRIPFTTLLKVALFLLGVLMVIRLRPVLIMIVVAAFIAVVLTPAEQWLERYMRRALAMTVVALLLFGILAAFLMLVVPQTIAQATQVAKEAPRVAQHVVKKWPATAPFIRSALEDLQGPPKGQQAGAMMKKGKMAAKTLVAAITAILFTLVLALYLVIDGKRLLAWLVSFAPETQRRKLALTFEEVQPLLIAYMRGQLITSTLSFLAAISVLMPFHVPAAMPLALLAFIGDFIPVAGFILALVPAVALAATVSPTAAITVAAVYVGYQMLENYVISPRVYGRQMEMSTLAVLLAITFGGALMGPVGAILILPLVASYPAIEKIWLRSRLPAGTIEKHDALEDGGNDAADEIVKP